MFNFLGYQINGFIQTLSILFYFGTNHGTFLCFIWFYRNTVKYSYIDENIKDRKGSLLHGGHLTYQNVYRTSSGEL